MIPQVIVHHSNFEPHTFQVETGFKMLHDAGLINLRAVKTQEAVYKRKTLPVTKVVANGRTLIYDTLDGYKFDHACSTEENLYLLDRVLSNCDFYFKRSYSSQFAATLSNKNLYPLGFNYGMYNMLFKDFKEYKFGSKLFIRSLLRYSKLLSGVFDLEYYKDILPGNLCGPPITSDNYRYPGSVLFLCRLWDPDEEDIPLDLKEERATINEMRVKCIRECKNNFGDLFLGGLYESDYARSYCPELIAPKSLTGKGNYLRLMKKAAICIATTGLHGSIGWKFGEYVACSKAIISEKLNYDAGNHFKEGRNFLTFSNVSEVPSIIQSLLDNPQNIKKMMTNNFNYYQQYLRPDKMILNTFKKAGII